MNGEGISIWPDGLKYQGFYKNNLKHGYGTLEYPNGTKYIGNFYKG